MIEQKQMRQDRKNRKEMRKNKGITLIALVITIIVLLILAAISIAMLTGENGILTQANNAKVTNEQAEEEELIQLAYEATIMKNYQNTDSSKTFHDFFEEELEKNGLEGSMVTDNADETYIVTLANGNQYRMGKDGKIENITGVIILEGKVDFKYSTEDWTNNDITIEVSISDTVDMTNKTIEYSKDQVTWNPYAEAITFSENGTLYVRITDENNTSQIVSTQVSKIDKTPPAIESYSIKKALTGIYVTYSVYDLDSGLSMINVTQAMPKYGEWELHGENTYVVESEFVDLGGPLNALTDDVTLQCYDLAGNVTEVVLFEGNGIGVIEPDLIDDNGVIIK